MNNFQNIIKTFKKYGFDVSELEEAVFDSKRTFLRFPAPGFRTELLPCLAGDISFNEAKGKAEKIELDGVNVPLIGYDYLVRSKTFTDRLKDKASLTITHKSFGRFASSGKRIQIKRTKGRRETIAVIRDSWLGDKMGNALRELMRVKAKKRVN